MTKYIVAPRRIGRTFARVTMEEFRQEFFGTWVSETPEEKQLRELAAEYHEAVARFDDRTCTGPIRNGSRMPMNANERSLITRNASSVWNRLRLQAEQLGFNSSQFLKAIHRASILKR